MNLDLTLLGDEVVDFSERAKGLSKLALSFKYITKLDVLKLGIKLISWLGS